MSIRSLSVLVIGGGYAGLSLLLKLADDPQFDLLLIDKNSAFLELTSLHESVHTPLAELKTPYAELADRVGFQFRQGDLSLDKKTLEQWQQQGAIKVANEVIAFDYLVICSGAVGADTNGPLLGLESLKKTDFAVLLQDLLTRSNRRQRILSIVGGGATGLQFLFELDDFLRMQRQPHDVNFIHAGERLLSQLPAGFHRPIENKIKARKGTIMYWPMTRFIAQDEGAVELENIATGKRFRRPSGMTLLLPGVRPQPALETNAYGQLEIDGRELPPIFAAGDCAHYQGPGLNTLTAQAAVHKAKQVATNIRRHAAGQRLLTYDYRELGYFVSLGPWDGIGWMGSPSNRLAGVSAYAAKNAIEARFKLFLEGGYDTYIV